MLPVLAGRVAATQRSIDRRLGASGLVVPIPGAQFDRAVDATQATLRALRALGRKLYYTQDSTPEDLGLHDLDPKIVAELHTLMRSSVYFEPKLCHPNMSEYPFLTLAGFDVSFGDPSATDVSYFECNLGSPWGLSINDLLLGRLRSIDGELATAAAAGARRPAALAGLGAALRSNALHWTGRTGEAVAVTPGYSNFGDPDAHAIAKGLGIRMAEPSELYVGADGWTRLDSGNAGTDQVVTAIYNYAYESFVLQSAVEGIPFRSSNFKNNPTLGQKLGVQLEAGAVYDFIYDTNGKIADVERDPLGRPLLACIPPNPKGYGSLAQAVRERKLYLSNLGGRVLDDKKLFSLVARHVAPRYALPDQSVASPPRSLSGSELQRVLESKDGRVDFVVKPSDGSCSVGVEPLLSLSASARHDLLERALVDPTLIVQERLPAMAAWVAESNDDGSATFTPVAADARVMVSFDAEGSVRSGPDGVLMRLAPPGGLVSQGRVGARSAPVVVIDSGEAD